VPPSATGQDFIGTSLVTTYSISGLIRDNLGDPVPGVTVSAGPMHSNITDANGHYLITGLSAGNFEVMPSYGCWTFSPLSLPVTVPPDSTGSNFVGTFTSQISVSDPIRTASPLGTGGALCFHSVSQPSVTTPQLICVVCSETSAFA
jgi:hypothetical protein